MHYLLHEKKLPETGSYMGIVLNQHLPVDEAIQKAYGVSPAKLEQAVKTYFQSIAPELSAGASKPAGTAASTEAGPIDRFPIRCCPMIRSSLRKEFRNLTRELFTRAFRFEFPNDATSR